MPRRSRYEDEDEERLPEGMRRVGYDADTGIYTFQDADGSYWESAPGSRYGRLTRVGHELGGVGFDDTEPFLAEDALVRPETSWRHDLGPLLSFGVIIGAFLLTLFWYLHLSSGGGNTDEPIVACVSGTSPYLIHKGDTCWSISESHGGSVNEILQLNAGLDCDMLSIGSRICLKDRSI